MTALLVIASCSTLGAKAQVSERAVPRSLTPSAERVSGGNPGSATRSQTCPSARKAIRFYVRATNAWRHKMGAAVGSMPMGRPHSCPQLRSLAKLWHAKAYAARRAYRRWWEREWHWQSWLPANWRRLGACETGYGREPGNWAWDSGSYVGAFGTYRPAYADDAHRIGNLSWDETKRRLHRLPTPREQYEAALSHYRTNGDGWGCPGP